MENKDHYSDYLAKQTKEAAWSEAFYNKTVHELNTNPRYKQYLSQFHPDSVKDFIKHYANLKTQWYKHGDEFSGHSRNRDEERTKEAIEVLKQIQLKKLFNLVCQWANYEISFSEIDIAFDLINYQEEIFNCPYLSPVEQHEIDTYADFLLHLPPEERYSWQQYYHISDGHFLTGEEPRWQTGEEYPPWFKWYDTVYHTDHMKDKPAPKIHKEDEYDTKGREYENQLNPQPPLPERKPYLSYYSFKDEYVQRFETDEYRKLYAAQRNREKQLAFAEEVDSDIILLCNAAEEVPVEDNPDWRKALTEAAEMYRRRMVIAELPYVYDDYLAKKKDGDTFDDWHDKDKDRWAGFIVKMKERILQGRKLMGEPADFNF